jgi:hypothetical protein
MKCCSIGVIEDHLFELLGHEGKASYYVQGVVESQVNAQSLPNKKAIMHNPTFTHHKVKRLSCSSQIGNALSFSKCC